MRYPNSFGSVIKLGGRRRKRYAVRISAGYKKRICIPNNAELLYLVDKYPFEYRKEKNDYVIYDDNDAVKAKLDEAGVPYRIEFVRKFRYLAYFEKSKDAHTYLSKMNTGEEMPEHVSVASEPSFKDVYDDFVAFMLARRNKPPQSTLTSWKTGFNGWSDLHDLRFRTVTTQLLQECISDKADMSQSTVGRMMTILRHMYKYSLANSICKEDRSKYIFIEYSKDKKIVHIPFTSDEIHALWKDVAKEGAKTALVLCYTGMRGTEFLTMRKSDVYLDKGYMIGGIKTENGRGRIIPIHDDLKPIIHEFMDRNNSEYLYPTQEGYEYKLDYFCRTVWNPYMEESGLNHLSHDGRHTLATVMEKSGIDKLHRQLILGHALTDVTDKVYTHVEPEALVKDINSIKW